MCILDLSDFLKIDKLDLMDKLKTKTFTKKYFFENYNLNIWDRADEF